MKKMTRKKIRRCNRRFFTAYGVLLVIAVLAVVFGYSYIRTYLTEYESVQTKYVADESFRMFRDLDYAALYACEKPENQALTDVQGYEAHASALLSGKEITYRDSYTGTEEEKIYNVYADGKRFATFSIRLSGETTSRGLEKWTYSGASINLLENAFRQFRVECYEGSRVFVDGVEIMEDQMTVIGELQGYEGHLKKGVELPKQYEYDQ